jgi:cyclomaltodextrinase / maltogenic alpha-amylase / neopullulanase
MSWANHAVFWHVYPLGFTGAPIRPEIASEAVVHRLKKLDDWVDYMTELGCTALSLGPIFASATHGYDTLDHFRIDPRLGDDADFDRLVSKLRARGVRLLLDGVFNHVGRHFPKLVDAAERGESSAYARWFRRSTRDGSFAVFEGHQSLVALNHDEPAVADYVSQVMEHWLSRGADGFRLDAAYAVPPRFWQPVLARVRGKHPEAWFVGEVIHGDYAAIAAQSGMDSVTQYELWKAIWSSLNDANLFELAWAFTRHAGFVQQFVPQTFVGNHDVTRIASKLRDIRCLPHALVVLFTVPGVPSVYAGDEQAFRGVKEDRHGGDDVIRPEFPSDPTALAREGWPVYRLHQALIQLRKNHPWLVNARLQTLSNTNQTIEYACTNGEHKLRVALNIAGTPFSLRDACMCVLSSSETQIGKRVNVVEPYGWLIVE